MNYLNSSNLDVEKLLPKKLNKTTIGLSLAGFATLGKASLFCDIINSFKVEIFQQKKLTLEIFSLWKFP